MHATFSAHSVLGIRQLWATEVIQGCHWNGPSKLTWPRTAGPPTGGGRGLVAPCSGAPNTAGGTEPVMIEQWSHSHSLTQRQFVVRGAQGGFGQALLPAGRGACSSPSPQPHRKHKGGGGGMTHHPQIFAGSELPPSFSSLCCVPLVLTVVAPASTASARSHLMALMAQCRQESRCYVSKTCCSGPLSWPERRCN